MLQAVFFHYCLSHKLKMLQYLFCCLSLDDTSYSQDKCLKLVQKSILFGWSPPTACNLMLKQIIYTVLRKVVFHPKTLGNPTSSCKIGVFWMFMAWKGTEALLRRTWGTCIKNIILVLVVIVITVISSSSRISVVVIIVLPPHHHDRAIVVIVLIGVLIIILHPSDLVSAKKHGHASVLSLLANNH